ncbi:hypothetical protein BJX99DRAFT_239446 [Aspergillus californicus]
MADNRRLACSLMHIWRIVACFSVGPCVESVESVDAVSSRCDVALEEMLELEMSLAAKGSESGRTDTLRVSIQARLLRSYPKQM